MGRFSSALTSLYGRDSNAWELKAAAVDVIGHASVSPSPPEVVEQEAAAQEAVEQKANEPEPIAHESSISELKPKTQEPQIQQPETPEPIRQEALTSEADSHEVLDELPNQSVEADSEPEDVSLKVTDKEPATEANTSNEDVPLESTVEAAEHQDAEATETNNDETEFAEFTLPEMFQPNPKGMYELRTQLGIFTKEDLRQEIVGGENQQAELDHVLANDQEKDESDAVLDLVQQVLGISPDIRVDGDSETGAQLETVEAQLINDRIDLAAKEASDDESSQQVAVVETPSQETPNRVASEAVSLDEPTEKTSLDEQVAKVTAMLAPATQAELVPENAAAPNVFQPVMETWANVRETPEVDRMPITAEQSPPLSNPSAGDPASDQNTRNYDDGLTAAEAAQEILATPDSGNSALADSPNSMVDSDSSLADTDKPEAYFSFGESIAETPVAETPVVEEPPVEAHEQIAQVNVQPQATSVEAFQPEDSEPAELAELSTNTQAWSPALGALGKLPDKVGPCNFESEMASRLLETNFGQHIEGMSETILRDTQNQSAVLLFLSLEPTEQQTDVVAGLAMYACAQRPSPTLLIDADCHLKTLSGRLGNVGEGLIEASDDTRPWYESVTATSCERLRFLRAGNADLDSSRRSDARASIQYMISEWKQSFGLVLIDGGSIDSKLIPILAEFADETFLTVQLGSDEREQLSQATERLAGFGATLKGCITTGPSAV